MSWVDVENALQFAVARASGYTTDRVFWSYQNVNEPELDHIKIHLGGEKVVGIDRLHITQDLARPNGQEIKQEVQGVREVPFEIECFTADTLGDLAARRVLELTRTKLRLPDVRSRLRKAGVAPFDLGDVSYVPDIPSADFRGRAVCTVRCYVPVSDCIEYVGYIARVRGTIFPVGFVGGHGASGIPFDSFGSSGGGITTLYTVYVGVSALPGAFDAAFITGLTPSQKTSRVGSFDFNAGAVQFCYLCLPTGFGGAPADFTDDATGIEADVSKVASAIDVSGIAYDVWQTEIAGLGAWRMDVA